MLRGAHAGATFGRSAASLAFFRIVRSNAAVTCIRVAPPVPGGFIKGAVMARTLHLAPQIRASDSGSNNAAKRPDTSVPSQHGQGQSPASPLPTSPSVSNGLNSKKETSHDAHERMDVPHVSFFSSPWGWLMANKKRFAVLAKRFGRLTIATYLGVYVLTLGGLFVIVRAGLVSPPDVNGFINGWFVKRALVGDTEVHVPPAWADFATAWVLTKFTEPVRLVATLALVPVIARRAPASVLRFFKALPAEAAQAAQSAIKHTPLK